MLQNDSPRRLVFVSSALTGPELKGGNRDVSTIHSVLTDPKFGACSPDSPDPLYKCDSCSKFEQALRSLLKHWSITDQLILYFSGHGEIQGEKYCLKFGKPDDEEYLPFDNILNELKIKRVTRAIIILDACFSGAGIKSDSIRELINFQQLPKGIAVLASSKHSQVSGELQDGSSSIFTTLFCEGITSGLKSKTTVDGLITVSDIVDFINREMESDDRFKGISQRPVYDIENADRSIWISKNVSGSNSGNKIESQPLITTMEELKVLYEETEPDQHPCPNASLDDLDWDLVENFYTKIYSQTVSNLPRDIIVKQLKLYSPIPYKGKECLHRSAVLCFAKRPDLFYPQAKSIFIMGNLDDERFSRNDVNGPLSRQVELLIDMVMERLAIIIDIGKNGKREEKPEIDRALVRELVSNAVVHRDYEQSGNVTVILKPDALEIKSPGRFPLDYSWSDVLKNSRFGSHPINIAVSYYLSKILVFEGVGRGLAVIKKYIEANKPDSVIMTEYPGLITCISVLRNKQSKLVNTETVITSIPSGHISTSATVTYPILIVTATKVETRAILNVFSTEAAVARHMIGGKIYYGLGDHSGVSVFMTQSEMGSSTPGGALLTVRQAIQDLRPQALIMCGIAYGLRPNKQKIGDILVAKQVQYYASQKIDMQNGQMPRGDRTTTSARLLGRARVVELEWDRCPIHFGLVLSGEILVDDPAFRDWLIKAEPEAIGGEIEGAGLYAAARDANVDWILVKAICDWADGKKEDSAQALAAMNAAQFVLHMLQLGE